MRCENCTSTQFIYVSYILSLRVDFEYSGESLGIGASDAQPQAAASADSTACGSLPVYSAAICQGQGHSTVQDHHTLPYAHAYNVTPMTKHRTKRSRRQVGLDQVVGSANKHSLASQQTCMWSRSDERTTVGCTPPPKVMEGTCVRGPPCTSASSSVASAVAADAVFDRRHLVNLLGYNT